ncbi:Enolase-phosphatase E1 [Entophlyctis sp. JEL0112]|nr:Enolase-phosphatase E1 [Entophlyctis sp. JEL0112]
MASCILLDIEGTTTSIAFVHDVLFPYAKENVLPFLSSRWTQPDVTAMIAALHELSQQDRVENPDAVNLPSPSDWKGLSKGQRKSAFRAYADYVCSLIASDRKVAPLKNLQGAIWEVAYKSRKVMGQFSTLCPSVYDDVVPSLEKWNSLNIPVYIYSSGSVGAQKLLFGYSEKGNLLKHFAGHFDTSIGNKLEKDSYTKIASAIGLEPSQILFLSDAVKEINAANKAGLQTCILFRPGNPPLDPPAKNGLYPVDGVLVRVCSDFNEVLTHFVPVSPSPETVAVHSLAKSKREKIAKVDLPKSAQEDVSSGWNGVAASTNTTTQPTATVPSTGSNAGKPHSKKAKKAGASSAAAIVSKQEDAAPLDEFPSIAASTPPVIEDLESAQKSPKKNKRAPVAPVHTPTHPAKAPTVTHAAAAAKTGALLTTKSAADPEKGTGAAKEASPKLSKKALKRKAKQSEAGSKDIRTTSESVRADIETAETDGGHQEEPSPSKKQKLTQGALSAVSSNTESVTSSPSKPRSLEGKPDSKPQQKPKQSPAAVVATNSDIKFAGGKKRKAAKVGGEEDGNAAEVSSTKETAPAKTNTGKQSPVKKQKKDTQSVLTSNKLVTASKPTVAASESDTHTHTAVAFEAATEPALASAGTEGNGVASSAASADAKSLATPAAKKNLDAGEHSNTPATVQKESNLSKKQGKPQKLSSAENNPPLKQSAEPATAAMTPGAAASTKNKKKEKGASPAQNAISPKGPVNNKLASASKKK